MRPFRPTRPTRPADATGRRRGLPLALAALTALVAAPVAATTVWAADGASPAARGVDGDAELPSDVLDLDDWKVTLPIGDDEDPTEIFQPELDGFSHDPYFEVTPSGEAVRFRAPVDGVTTGGSSYPRSELREMEPGGEDETEWSSTSGTHIMTVREAFTHLPEERPWVVGAQIHGGDDDVTVVRLEDDELWITEGDTRHHHLLTDEYELGTVFEITYVVSDGEIEVHYNGELATTLDHSDSTNYFKAGAYTQANCQNSSPCDEDNYGEVEIHELTVEHR
ncbi:Alginate lyase [Streptomyces zhaozhouensis]|uniref:Alginate lyase n=1 Tax=Streptomyces zhaozhouensis TaxID=1300267 RepID=A0A286DUC0_9ACTN|nr:polysaccharide lyase family 7 protein [Streptomyces zhaozhouensis]SOD62261.1 Alginate lyase [Streptomyces zhaozhouensis]